MDDIIIGIYQLGIYVILAIALFKAFIILLYRGPNLRYLISRFLVVYDYPNVESGVHRKKFKSLHNAVTLTFYFTLLMWLAIAFVISNAR